MRTKSRFTVAALAGVLALLAALAIGTAAASNGSGAHYTNTRHESFVHTSGSPLWLSTLACHFGQNVKVDSVLQQNWTAVTTPNSTAIQNLVEHGTATVTSLTTGQVLYQGPLSVEQFIQDANSDATTLTTGTNNLGQPYVYIQPTFFSPNMDQFHYHYTMGGIYHLQLDAQDGAWTGKWSSTGQTCSGSYPG